MLPEAMLDEHARQFPAAFDRRASAALYAIRALAQRVNDAATSWLAPYGLNASKYNYLAILHFAGGNALTLNELSELVHTSNAAVTLMVTTLEAEGLVERLPNPNDRRSSLVRLTAKGRETFRRVLPVHHAHSSRVTSDVSDDDLDHLLATLQKIAGGIEQIER